MSTPLPKREGAAPTEVAPQYHSTLGLNYRLVIDHKLYVYSEYLDAWVNTLWADDALTGDEIYRRTWEAPVRLEVVK